MMDTLYRRPLPADAVAFSSAPGRALFAEALATGGLDGYFPLAEQFHTQADPAFCGLGSLVVALNALAIDPGRLWKGPWRWFAEDLLDCCVPLDEIRRRGLDLDELACLARCNAAEVELHRAEHDGVEAWRAALAIAAAGSAVVIASYDRSALGQTGAGHFSPVGGYHAGHDLALVLDVARFKYPPHWIGAEPLWRAMQPVDPATGRSRGWLVIRARAHGGAVGFSLRCDGAGWQALADRLARVVTELADIVDVAALARAVVPLAGHLTIRAAGTEAHADALASARTGVARLALHAYIVDAVGPTHAEGVALLMLAIADRLPPPWRAALAPLVALTEVDDALAGELTNLRAQMAAVWTLGATGPGCAGAAGCR